MQLWHKTKGGHILLTVLFYFLLITHPNMMPGFFFFQIDAEILYFNKFITLLYMFRALYCARNKYNCWTLIINTTGKERTINKTHIINRINYCAILEAAVGIIQSYVFAILRTSYAREVN